MKKIIYILILTPFTLFGQEVIGLIQNSQEAYNGYTLINPLRSSSTYLIDNCGNNIYEWQSTNKALDAKLLRDGGLIRTIMAPSDSILFGGTTGGIEILDPSSNQIWEILINSDSSVLHHDIEILPNGNILAIVAELIDSVDLVNAGSISKSKRLSETIIEINRESQEIVWQWSALDHIIQDAYPLLPNYGEIATHPEKIDINYNVDEDNVDWLHINSIDYNADLDQIMIGSPHFNELWIIDHSTSTFEASTNSGGNSNKGGDLLYRWGNPFAYKRGLESDQKFLFQHDCRWVEKGLPDEGKIMIFNNGEQRLYSSVDIIDPYMESNNYILSHTFTYLPNNLNVVYSDSANFFSKRVSSAYQLENGNIFICAGWEGRIFEVETLSNSVVWDYQIPFAFGVDGNSSIMSQGDSAGSRRIFQSTKYPTSFEAFEYLDIDLETSSPIEYNPFSYDCQTSFLGCTDSDASNFNSNATQNDGSCVTWEELVGNLQAQLDSITLGDATSDQNTEIFIELPQGWSMFGYTCLESLNVVEAFSSISDKIQIVKDEWGLAYLPAWGFSAFDNLEFGEGYQIKMIEGVTNFQFCRNYQ